MAWSWSAATRPALYTDQIEAAGRFFDNAKVVPAEILAPHRAAIVERIRQGGHPRVLLVQDTMES